MTKKKSNTSVAIANLNGAATEGESLENPSKEESFKKPSPDKNF